MIEERECEFCGTPFDDDRDENGEPYCDCEGAELAKANQRIAELEAQAVELEKWHTLYNVCIYKREEERLRIAELEAALRRLEWVWSDAGPAWCRECGAPRTLGHDESCRLGILLNHKEA